jgi:hypothetical protein
MIFLLVVERELRVEKREGTIGLLIFTDLRGHEVVLGKLLATSLRAGCMANSASACAGQGRRVARNSPSRGGNCLRRWMFGVQGSLRRSIGFDGGSLSRGDVRSSDLNRSR